MPATAALRSYEAVRCFAIRLTTAFGTVAGARCDLFFLRFNIVPLLPRLSIDNRSTEVKKGKFNARIFKA